jgi:hypothetical protein
MSILSQQKQSVSTDFPNVRPSLDLRFALAKKLDPRITFTRGSTGTYVGPDGLIKTADTNIPRFDHDPITGQSLGLLIEESRSNYFWGTQPGNGGSVTDGTATGADGVIAKKFVPTLGNASYPSIYSNTPYTFTAASGGTVDVSFSGYFAAIGTGLYVPDIVIQFTTGGTTNAVYAELLVNLTDGTVLSTSGFGGGVPEYSQLIAPQITLMPFGMYKVTWSIRYTQGATIRDRVDFYIQCRKKTYPSGATGTYYADGINGFQYSCIQYEVGGFPTSYIPTTTSAVTRSADLASMTGVNFSSWYNQSEGTIVISTDKLYSGNFDTYRHPYRIDSGSNADQITAYTMPGSTLITNYGIVTGGRQVNDYQTINIGSSPTQFKIAQSFNSKYFFFTSSKGTTPPQLPSKSAPNAQNLSLATNMSRLFIGNSAGVAQINSHLARFTYYPIQITNQQLINLTS